jgi:uncharacterized membrane protein YeaQ/YmgE (transglycosylase-associated protein family)
MAALVPRRVLRRNHRRSYFTEREQDLSWCKKIFPRMSIFILLTLGGALGWGASVLVAIPMRGINILAGMFGALLGGWLLSPLFGGSVLSADGLGVGSLLEAAAGAIILIVLVQLVRKGMSDDA